MSKKRILVVDDEPDVLELISSRLEASGYEVLKASDGASALVRIRKSEPDLVILDVLMPVMTGCQVVGNLRSLPGEVGNTPVLLLTAVPETKYLMSSVDVQGFMAKPFNAEELLQKIEAILAEKAA